MSLIQNCLLQAYWQVSQFLAFLHFTLLLWCAREDRIKEETILRRIDPKVILIVTGEMHSRSAWRVYHKIFPDTKILITCIPYRLEFEKNHPIKAQTTLWNWFLANIGRQAILRIPFLGFRIVRSAQHKTVIT